MTNRRRDPNESNKADREDRKANLAKGGSVDKNGVVRRVRSSHTDWDTFKNAFINAYDKELIEFCYESTKNPNDPKYKTAETKAREGKWLNLKRIQMSEDPDYMDKLTKDLSAFDFTTVDTVRDSRLKLVDANKTIERHLKVAGELSSIVSFHTPKILEASKLIDWSSLALEDPKTFFSAVKDLTAILEASIKIERTSLDLANVKIDIVQTSKPVQETKDYSGMSDAELSALYLDSLKTIDV